MRMSEEDRRLLTVAVTANFRSFGGGVVTPGNPLSAALRDEQPQFAAGVDIRKVVDFVVDHVDPAEGEEPNDWLHAGATLKQQLLRGLGEAVAAGKPCGGGA